MRFKPNKSARAEFAARMRELESFLQEHPEIGASTSRKSFYFEIGGVSYRVSNHTPEASNAAAFDDTTGEQCRALYHPNGREADTVYITASPLRLPEIFEAIAAGHSVDARGRVCACR